ncbi:MAG: hypothetical protein V4649_07325 [Bacteroidota bacterium]
MSSLENRPFEENSWNDEEKDSRENVGLFRQLETEFPLSGGETDEDLREALGNDSRTDDEEFVKRERVSYPLPDTGRVNEAADDDDLDDDVPPRSEWRGF